MKFLDFHFVSQSRFRYKYKKNTSLNNSISADVVPHSVILRHEKDLFLQILHPARNKDKIRFRDTTRTRVHSFLVQTPQNRTEQFACSGALFEDVGGGWRPVRIVCIWHLLKYLPMITLQCDETQFYAKPRRKDWRKWQEREGIISDDGLMFTAL